MADRFRIFTGLFLALLLTVVVATLAAEAAGTRDPRPTPIMSSVEPSTGRPGDVLTVTGTFLDKSLVRELYLTDGTLDLKAEMIEQSATTIRFKIPAAKPGRYRLMVLTTEEPPMLLEQPTASLTVTETR